MSRQILLTLTVGLALVLSAWRGLAAPQNPQEPQGRRPARQPEEQSDRAFGTIASIGIDRFAIKKLDGTTKTVMVNDKTRFLQGQQEIQLEDLKEGDRVFVRGRTNDDKEFVAFAVRRLTDDELMRFQNVGERAFGNIVSIDKNQLKLRNRFQGEKTVVVNEQTVFMRDGQAILLKDLKVGDRIVAVGKETGGKFVATRVVTGQFQRGGEQLRRELQGTPEER